jgi:SAM-dependent methyltransferase
MASPILRLIPKPLKAPLRANIDRYRNNHALKVFFGHISILKYHPEAYGSSSYVISKHRTDDNNEGEDDGLPVPPRPLWIGYGNDFGDKGKEWYVTKGKRDVDKMLQVLTASDFSLQPGRRVLEMGCAAGRMIRHLKTFSDSSEIWGVDVNAPLINWCKCNLSPPFHFATTTTIPHLPFSDSYFDFIYTGSVFTHIDDLAEAWLLELRRILSPEGRLYVTIHDRHTIKMLDDGYFYDKTGYFTDKNKKETDLTSRLNSNPVYNGAKDTFGMFVMGRDFRAQVFYDMTYFREVAANCKYDILSVTEEAYGHQTAVLLKKH